MKALEQKELKRIVAKYYGHKQYLVYIKYKFAKYSRGTLLHSSNIIPNRVKYALILGIVKYNWGITKYIVKYGIETVPKLKSTHYISSINIDELEKFYKLSLADTLKRL